MARGFDTATPCSQSVINAAVSSEYTFACRYYCTETLSKLLKKDEALRFSNSGIDVVPVYQISNNSIGSFTTATGNSHGRHAYEYEKYTMQQPTGTPIYFAVDYDATTAQLQAGILDYFRAIQSQFLSLGGEYTIGVYGSGRTCSYFKNQLGICTHSWLSMSTGHAGHYDYLNGGTWNIHQINGSSVGGISIDINESNDVLGHGGWNYNSELTNAQYQELNNRLVACEEREGSRYQTLVSVPGWATDAIQNAINRGVLQGDGTSLDLSYADVKALVMDYRRANL